MTHVPVSSARKPAAHPAVRPIAWLILLACVIALPIWHIHVIDRDMPRSHNDLITRWIGTQEALRGKDPYSPQVMHELQRQYYGRALTPADNMDPQEFDYPAYLVLLFAPFAHASWTTACLVFLIVIPPLLAWSFWACVGSLNLSISTRQTALAVFLGLCSWPVMWSFRLQQPTLLVAIAVFFGSFLLNRNHGIPAGILFALSTIKPHLVLLLLAWLLVWAIVHRCWSVIVSFAITLSLLLIGAEALVPGWFGHWRNSVRGYGSDTLLPLQAVLGHWPGVVATVLLAAWGASLLWRLRRAPAGSTQFGLAVGLALSVAVSVNLFKLPLIYNHVFALPGCLILIYSRPQDYGAALARRVAIAMIACGYLAVGVAVLCETFFGPSDLWDSVPCRNPLLPVLVAVALAVQAGLEVRAQHRATSLSAQVQAEVAS